MTRFRKLGLTIAGGVLTMVLGAPAEEAAPAVERDESRGGRGAEAVVEAVAGPLALAGVGRSVSVRCSEACSGAFRAPSGSVRESSVVRVGGCWAAFADVVPWDSPYHPNTYSTSIYVFDLEKDGTWRQGVEVVWPGAAEAWDHGGTATPGAVCWNGEVLLFYSGRQNGDGTGHRHIGLARAHSAHGPFVKLPEPVVAGSGHRDDPCPVQALDGKGILLYYRLADGGRYAIRLASASSPEGPWLDEGEVVPAVGNVRAVETTDAKKVGDWIVLAVMEHDRRPGHGIRTALYVSKDGRKFRRTEPPAFEDLVPAATAPGMASHLSLHVTEEGVVSALGVTRLDGPAGRYTRFVYPVHSFDIE